MPLALGPAPGGVRHEFEPVPTPGRWSRGLATLAPLATAAPGLSAHEQLRQRLRTDAAATTEDRPRRVRRRGARRRSARRRPGRRHPPRRDSGRSLGRLHPRKLGAPHRQSRQGRAEDADTLWV